MGSPFSVVTKCWFIGASDGNSAIAWELARLIKLVRSSSRFCSIGTVQEMVFIVQGKPRSPEGILKVIKETRRDAMQAASELLEHGMAFVTIIAEGRVYTVEEFARTILDCRD